MTVIIKHKEEKIQQRKMQELKENVLNQKRKELECRRFCRIIRKTKEYKEKSESARQQHTQSMFSKVTHTWFIYYKTHKDFI